MQASSRQSGSILLLYCDIRFFPLKTMTVSRTARQACPVPMLPPIPFRSYATSTPICALTCRARIDSAASKLESTPNGQIRSLRRTSVLHLKPVKTRAMRNPLSFFALISSPLSSKTAG